jgi:nucleotide-binding universal stress UspA family protein
MQGLETFFLDYAFGTLREQILILIQNLKSKIFSVKFEEISFVFKTILVALDASEQADRVIQAIEQLQLQLVKKIVLAHVILPPDGDSDWAADRPHNSLEENPYLSIEKHLQSYQSQLPCASELEIVTGDPAQEIIRLANIHKADLIALGSRGLTGLKRIIQGSVSGQVVEEAPCSVLVVKIN